MDNLAVKTTVSIDISSDGTTVWVNDAYGCIGRFSKKFGIDVHTSVEAQMEGAPQCLYCTHGPADALAWERFCNAMHTFHRVEVPKDLVKFVNG